MCQRPRRATRALCIATAAVPPLIAAITTTAATLFCFHSRSAKKTVLAVLAALSAIIFAELPANGAATGFASCAPVFRAPDVV